MQNIYDIQLNEINEYFIFVNVKINNLFLNK